MQLPLAILTALVAAGAFYFTYRIVQSNNQKAEGTATVTREEAAKRDEMRLLDRSLSAVRGDRVILNTHFAKSSDVVPFLNEIENSARAIGIVAEVENVNLLPSDAGLSVRVSADGSFRSLHTFITLLEQFPYIVEFTSLNIENVAIGTTDKTTNWHAEMTLKLITFVK